MKETEHYVDLDVNGGVMAGRVRAPVSPCKTRE